MDILRDADQDQISRGLFRRFDKALKDAGYLAISGQIIDASVVTAPRQNLTDEEKAAKPGK